MHNWRWRTIASLPLQDLFFYFLRATGWAHGVFLMVDLLISFVSAFADHEEVDMLLSRPTLKAPTAPDVHSPLPLPLQAPLLPLWPSSQQLPALPALPALAALPPAPRPQPHTLPQLVIPLPLPPPPHPPPQSTLTPSELDRLQCSHCGKPYLSGEYRFFALDRAFCSVECRFCYVLERRM